MEITNLNSGNVTDKTCPSIYISLGKGQYVGLNQESKLMFFDENHAVILGAFSQAKVDSLCEYLQRLKIHIPA